MVVCGDKSNGTLWSDGSLLEEKASQTWWEHKAGGKRLFTQAFDGHVWFPDLKHWRVYINRGIRCITVRVGGGGDTEENKSIAQVIMIVKAPESYNFKTEKVRPKGSS